MHVVSPRVMICIKTQYFNFHRILLLTIGLWPYQQSKLVQLQLTLFFGILSSFIISQFAAVVFAECTIDVVRILSTVLIHIMFMIKYNSFRINIQIIKQFFEELQHICNELEDKHEIAIIKEYGNNTKFYMAIIMLYSFCTAFVILSLSILPFIPGVDLIKESQLRHAIKNAMPIYYVNPEKYFYLMLLHVNVSILIGATALVAAAMMLIGCLKHTCGMFKIASYRIEKALMANTAKKIILKDEIVIYKEIILAIDIHRKAIKLSMYLISNFQGSYFFLIMVGVICLSFNLYGISETATHGDNILQFIKHLVTTGGIFIYLFLINHAGQEITDHNDDVFSTAYNGRWYVAPLQVQKLILFLLQRGNKTISLNLGGIFVLSLEFFATLTKASISYFTVVYSMQQ